MAIREKYFWIFDLLRSRPNESYYVFSPSMVKPDLVEDYIEFTWGGLEDEQQHRATPQMIREGLSILNKYYYDCMINGWDDHLVTENEVALMFQAIMKLGGIYGFYPTMKAYTPTSAGERFLNAANERIKRIFEEAVRKRPEVGREHAPEYMRSFPGEYPNDSYIRQWQWFAFQAGMPDHEIEKFIAWFEYGYTPAGHPPLAEIVRLAANVKVSQEQNKPEYKRRHREACTDYIAHMAVLPMQALLGVDFRELPYEKREPSLRKVSQRIGWQLSELQAFIRNCFLIIPYTLAREPIKVQSGRYDESMRFERTQQDLINEKAIELTNLPRFSAYAKVLYENENKQTVWTGKLLTSPLPPEKNNLEDEATQNGHDLSRKRTDIEEQIKERQEKWRVVVPQTPSEPPEEPPPPTTF